MQRLEPARNVGGRYERNGEFESAVLEVVPLGPNHVHVSGVALWGKGRKYGSRMGTLDFTAEIASGSLSYSEANLHPAFRGQEYRLRLTFSDSGLTAEEEYVVGMFAMGVRFGGKYEKVIDYELRQKDRNGIG